MPHHPHHPHPHPHHPHPHPHHGPRGWVFHDSKFTSRSATGLELQTLGGLLTEHSRIEFGSTEFSIPSQLRQEIVYERTPHGTFVLRVHLEWNEDIPGTDHSPRHPHEHHRRHHRPRGWVFHDSKFTSRSATGLELQTLGGLLTEHSRIEFGSTEFSIPSELRQEIVYERTPHGTFVLRVHLEWNEDIPEYSDSTGATFRAANRLEAGDE